MSKITDLMTPFMDGNMAVVVNVSGSSHGVGIDENEPVTRSGKKYT
jgi:hypothetical protein